MNPATPPSWSPAVAARLLRPAEYVSLIWENELLPAAELAVLEGAAARAFATRGVVISPWHGRMPEARATLAAGRVVALDGALEIDLGPGLHKSVRVLLAEPPGRQPLLFVAIDGFFSGERSPYATPGLRADTLAFALAVEALLAAAVPAGGPFIWANEWETAPALLLLGARHATALHLHSAQDAWLGPVLPQFAFAGSEALARDTALRAALMAADVTAAVNPGFAQALCDPAWPVYPDLFAPHLQDVLGRIVAVTSGPVAAMQPEWTELMLALAPDAHAAGRIFAADVGARRRRALPLELRRTICGRMIVFAGGRHGAQEVPEVAIAAVRRVLAGGDPAGFFVFAPWPGDKFAERWQGGLRALRDEFPRDVLVVEGDTVGSAALQAVADVRIFPSLWETHGPVFHGPALPIAFGEGPGAQIHSRSARGPGAAWQARFHRPEEPRNGWWLYPHVAQRVGLTVEHTRALAAGPPAADNRVFGAMVDELATALRMAALSWRLDPVCFAALVFAALRRQAGQDWRGADSYGRMFALMAAVSWRPRRAA